MDPKILADALTTFLAPAMPYLMSGGTELIQEAGKALNVELIKKLWARLRPKVEEKPAAIEAAQDVAKAPEDEDARASLRLQLRKLLEEDASLASELAKLVEAAGPRQTVTAQLHGSGAIAQGTNNVVAGAGGIAAGRDVLGARVGKPDS